MTTDELNFHAPASEISFAKESKSLEGLIARIEELFDCRDGPYQSWVEHEGKRLPYVTLGISTLVRKNEIDQEIAETMRNRLLDGFITIREDLINRRALDKSLVGLDLESRRFPLYWRFAREARMMEEVEPSPNGKGKIRKGHYRQSLRTRVAVPRANWDLLNIVTFNGKIHL